MPKPKGKPKAKPRRKVWDFDEWFRLQHGARPGGDVTDREIEERVRSGEFWRGLGIARSIWDERRTSALYAWQIPDMSKPISQRWHTTGKNK